MNKNNNSYSESLEVYFRDIDKFKILSREEEKFLFERIKNGDEEAKKKMISSNLRFVVSMAKKFLNRGLSIEDLISEGNIGLLKSVDKFDSNRGFKFISYASWWIRQSILKSIYDKSKTIRLPGQAFAKALRIKKEMDLLEDFYTYKQKIKIIAKKLKMIPQEVSYLIKIYEETVSLETTKSKNELNLKDILQDERLDSVEETVIKNDYKNIILKNLNTLSERDLNILDARFGLTHKYSLSLLEIGLRFNISKERVRQIQDKALKKLRDNKEILELTYQ